MCLATAAVLASAGSSVVGGMAAGNAANYQAQVAANNATIARQNAAYSASAGSSQVTQEGLRARAQNAGAKVSQAALGLDVNTGSAADVETSQRELGALDTATVANRAAEAVYGYQSQATSFQAQSQLDKAQVAPDEIGGFLKGFGQLAGNAPSTSLLSGAPTVPPEYAWMQGTSGAGAGAADVSADLASTSASADLADAAFLA